MIEDDLFFYILGKMKRFGHPDAPLQIVKKKHTFIIGHRKKNYFDGRETLEEVEQDPNGCFWE